MKIESVSIDHIRITPKTLQKMSSDERENIAQSPFG